MYILMTHLFLKICFVFNDRGMLFLFNNNHSQGINEFNLSRRVAKLL